MIRHKVPCINSGLNLQMESALVYSQRQATTVEPSRSDLLTREWPDSFEHKCCNVRIALGSAITRQAPSG